MMATFIIFAPMVNKRNRPLRQHVPRHSSGKSKTRRSPYGAHRRKRTRLKWLFWTLSLVALLSLGAYFGYRYYTTYMQAATISGQLTYVYVRKGDTEQKVISQISERSGLRHPRLFARYASSRRLGSSLRPGRYGIVPGMTAQDIIDKLTQGKQTPVRLDFRAVRTQDELIELLAKNLQLPADSFRSALNDSTLCRQYGDFTSESIRCLFIPAVYEIDWNVSPIGLLDTMKLYYDRYWTASRRVQTNRLGLSPIQVAIVASIVQSESKKQDEYAQIAGLYLNRLRKGMLLQADPTVKFANNNFDLRRITGEYLRTDSPYNTYRYKGLPPGPICLPQTATMDSVLAATAHPYVYMCAREDFSGYHAFAATYAQHMVNARRYQAELDKRNIK